MAKSCNENQNLASDDWVESVKESVIDWGKTNSQDFPWRKRGLPVWQGLIAEFLLLRTRANQVAPVFERIQRRFPEASAFSEVHDGVLKSMISSLGLQWRQPLFVKLAREIANCGGDVPDTLDELKSLPGVGDYVAAATIAFYCGRRAVIVDSNVVRILCRLVGKGRHGETRREKWLLELADRLTPDLDFRNYGYALLDISMTICRPRQPLCAECALATLCATGQSRISSGN